MEGRFKEIILLGLGVLNTLSTCAMGHRQAPDHTLLLPLRHHCTNDPHLPMQAWSTLPSTSQSTRTRCKGPWTGLGLPWLPLCWTGRLCSGRWVQLAACCRRWWCGLRSLPPQLHGVRMQVQRRARTHTTMHACKRACVGCALAWRRWRTCMPSTRATATPMRARRCSWGARCTAPGLTPSLAQVRMKESWVFKTGKLKGRWGI